MWSIEYREFQRKTRDQKGKADKEVQSQSRPMGGRCLFLSGPLHFIFTTFLLFIFIYIHIYVYSHWGKITQDSDMERFPLLPTRNYSQKAPGVWNPYHRRHPGGENSSQKETEGGLQRVLHHQGVFIIVQDFGYFQVGLNILHKKKKKVSFQDGDSFQNNSSYKIWLLFFVYLLVKSAIK